MKFILVSVQYQTNDLYRFEGTTMIFANQTGSNVEGIGIAYRFLFILLGIQPGSGRAQLAEGRPDFLQNP